MVDTVTLLGDTKTVGISAGSDGHGGTMVQVSPTGVRADFDGDGKSDILIENTVGAVIMGTVVGGQRSRPASRVARARGEST